MQSFLFGNYLGMRLGSHMCWVHSFLSNYQFQLPFYTPTSNRWDPSSLLLAIVSSFNFGHPDVVLLLHHGNLNFPMTTDFGHLLIYLVVICISSFVKHPFKCFAFVIGFFLLSYIFWTKFFFIYIYIIFSPSPWLPFHFLVFQRTEICNFGKAQLISLFVYGLVIFLITYGVLAYLKIIFSHFLMFTSRSLIVLAHKCRSVIHF